MRKLFVLITIFVFLFSYTTLNKDLLLIEAKLYPKIIMLIKNFKDKKVIKLAIFASNNSENAQIFKSLIKNKHLKVTIINKIDLNYDVYILMKPINLKLLKMLIKNKKVIFSVLPQDINTSMFSIYIGARVYPYINPFLIKEAKIQIDPILFKVGKIYE